jgi:outer membrane protein OmpA-like peptidoglycan-associated protein
MTSGTDGRVRTFHPDGFSSHRHPLTLLEETLSFRCFLPVLLLLAVALCTPSPLSAQNPGDPKAEVFGGYSWYRSGATVNGVAAPDFTTGWAGQFIYNLNHQAGMVVDVNGHKNNFGSILDFGFGARYQFPFGHFIPFGEGLLGAQHFSPNNSPSRSTATYLFGGGIDVKINSRFSVRPFEVSYVYTNYAYTPSSGSSQVNTTFNGVRMQAGLIYNLGLPSPEGEVIASCSAEPPVVDAGAAVKVGVTAVGFLPKRKLRYSYATNGGAIAGSTATESVDTKGVGSGSYTVTAKVVDNGKGKHRQTASCEAKFTVNAKQPPPSPPMPAAPTAPETQKSGEAATATANAPEASVTPQTSSNVSAPEASVPLQTSKFGTIEFERDVKRPTRVDNEAKGELDRYADALAAAPDSKAVVVGYAAAKEDKDSKKVLRFAGQRAVNTKDYVNKEKGVDSARIETRTGSGDGQKVELWIVPAGATFAAEGTTLVDESQVKAVPRVPLKATAVHKNMHRRSTHKNVHKTVRNSN